MEVKQVLIDCTRDGESLCFRLSPETFAEVAKTNANSGPWQYGLWIKCETEQDWIVSRGIRWFMEHVSDILTGMTPQQLAECGYEGIVFRDPITPKVLRNIAIP